MMTVIQEKKELKSQLHECQLENVQFTRKIQELTEVAKEFKVFIAKTKDLHCDYKTLLANSARIELSKLSDDELLEVIS